MVHPKAKQIYDDNNLFYLETAHDQTEKLFKEKSKDRPIKTRVDAIYRLKVGGEEYLYWSETQFGTDYMGNRISWFNQVGKWDLPIVHKEYFPDQNKSIATNIDDFEEQFDYPFTKEKLEELLKLSHHKTMYMIDSGYIKYGSFSRDEFLNKSFDELLYKGKTGLETGTQMVSPEEARSVRRADKQLNTEQRIGPKS